MQRRANGEKYQGPFCLVSILDKEIILKADYDESDTAGMEMLQVRSGCINRINGIKIIPKMQHGAWEVRDKDGFMVYNLPKSCNSL